MVGNEGFEKKREATALYSLENRTGIPKILSPSSGCGST